MSEEAKEAGSPTQDERVMAAVAHATIIFSAVGLIGPLIIWGTQREKSPFLAFQALQAGAIKPNGSEFRQLTSSSHWRSN